jgi:hypothetical protein
MRLIQVYSHYNLLCDLIGIPRSNDQAIIYDVDKEDKPPRLELNSEWNAPIFRGIRRFKGQEQYIDAVVEQSLLWLMYYPKPFPQANEFVSDLLDTQVWDEEDGDGEYDGLGL